MDVGPPVRAQKTHLWPHPRKKNDSPYPSIHQLPVASSEWSVLVSPSPTHTRCLPTALHVNQIHSHPLVPMTDSVTGLWDR